jgi:hypothetical protein
VLAGFLGGVDELPALVEILGGRNFHGDILALLHGIDSHRHMVVPVGSDIYEIYVWTPAQFHPRGVTDILGSCRTVILFWAPSTRS